MGFSSPHTNNEQESCHKAGQNTTHAYNHQVDKFPDWTEANALGKFVPDAGKTFICHLSLLTERVTHFSIVITFVIS
jgi:predicted CxxxxCH...CXXCH cytochrome family protein